MAAARGNAGTSLVEVLVAVVIFVGVVVGLGNSVLSARRTSDTSRQLAEATTLAVDKIEHLRTQLLVSPELLPGTHNDSANPLRPDATTGGVFSRRWVVTSNLPIAGMNRVEMTVTWNDRGRTGSVTLVSYLSLA